MKQVLCAGVSFALLILSPMAIADDLPQGYWGKAKSQPLIDQVKTITLNPDLSHLPQNEQDALAHLLAAGPILQDLYEQQKHAGALAAREALNAMDGDAANNLRTLYRIFKGPIVTTLDNQRATFLPVETERKGGNMYPAGVATQALTDAINAADNPRLLGDRTVVRAANEQSKTHDLAILAANPANEALHPGLGARIEAAADYYAVPYSLAYVDELKAVSTHLSAASALMRETDEDFADYLDLRARDILSDNYEGGDAAWVSGQFGNLNAQIGSYETYDDTLFGVKTFFSLSLLAKNPERSAALTSALTHIQKIEDQLPYDSNRKVRDSFPVGVYNIIADFGQSRGTNTATILPNDADHTRKYGRTILLRYNIMSNPEIFAESHRAFAAAMAPQFHEDFVIAGNFQRTLWHEVGHYLGVSKTEDGRDLSVALKSYSDLIEEMKSDLVSLNSAKTLHALGVHDDATLRAIYTGGVRRVLQSVKPRRTQAYQTMQLMQWNYFLEHGLLSYDDKTNLLSIDYKVYHDVVTALLAEVLAVQLSGDPERAAAFVERYGSWKDDLHGVIAANIRGAKTYRYSHVLYGALGEAK